jgi:hypothetical protein
MSHSSAEGRRKVADREGEGDQRGRRSGACSTRISNATLTSASFIEDRRPFSGKRIPTERP